MAAPQQPETGHTNGLPLAPNEITTGAFTQHNSESCSDALNPAIPYPYRIVWPKPPKEDIPPSGTATEIAAHKMLGPYEVLDEIARGGMGVIYKARDTRLNRIVALKMLRTGTLSHPEELLRFQREAKTQAKLQHRHILPILDVGECDGVQYFTMPLVLGGSVSSHRKDFAGQPHKVVALVEKVARAVAYAHQHGILHRDLKPGNILLDENGEPLVMDFGLAKLEDSSVLLTRTHQVIGTPAYMAPEQADSGSPRAPTVQTDVWSLGVLLYELLTGELPFQGANASAVMEEILHKEPPAPRRIKADLDPALEKIVLRCLEKVQPWRYPSAAALADDLARWQKGEKVPSIQMSMRQRFQWTARRFRKRTLMGLVLVLLVGLVLWLAWSGKNTPSGGVCEEPGGGPDEFQVLLAPLLQGQPVTIIGPTAGPKTPVKNSWGQITDICRSDDHRFPCFFHGEGACRLQLIPPGYLPPRYRLRVEFRQDRPEFGIVGFYLLHHVHRLPQNREADLYVSLTVGKPETVLEEYKENKRPSRYWLWGHFDPAKNWPDGMLGFSWEDCCPLPPKEEADRSHNHWRTLVLDVRPEGIEAVLDGTGRIKASQKALKPSDEEISSKKPFTWEEASNAFARDGGLGLYLYSSRMTVRNMVVEPLPK